MYLCVRSVWNYLVDGPEREAMKFESTLAYDALGGLHGMVGSALYRRCRREAEPMVWLEVWQSLLDNAPESKMTGAEQKDLEMEEHNLQAKPRRGTSVYRHRPMQAMLKGRISFRSQDGFTHLHNFRQQRRAIAVCDHCERKIWGFVGWVCVDCEVTCHDKCRALIPPNCKSSSAIDRFGRRAETQVVRTLPLNNRVLPRDRSLSTISSGSAVGAEGGDPKDLSSPTTPVVPPRKSKIRASVTNDEEASITATSYPTLMADANSQPSAASEQSVAEGQQSLPHDFNGYLHKVGGRVRNWKRRWFHLDSKARLLRYFAPPKVCIPALS